MENIQKYNAASYADAVAAISRWESEGGALRSPELPLPQRPALTKAELHSLECLGAAVIAEWSELPKEVQRALTRRTASLENGRRAPSKGLIAHFLRRHKDASAPFEAEA
ncbi:hypothetical protein [Xanthobacter agilis]|jgi:hypothetical protein|uniref:Transcriptional regulator n=1 Tax=Xanthobacter agilis TaxID=47492 RepID=A0ABU0LI38_XANAG|nr:hypothetical protein [Xanthobacter agilis]